MTITVSAAVNPRATTPQQVDAATDAILAAKARLAAAQAAVQTRRGQSGRGRGGFGRCQSAALLHAYCCTGGGPCGDETVQPGNVVAAGTAMMAVVSDEVWVTANYKETQLAGIRLGATADSQRRCRAGGHVQGQGGQHPIRHRRGVFAAAGPECHRQLHQGDPARAGETRFHR